MLHILSCSVHEIRFVTILNVHHSYACEETLKNEKIDYFCIITVLVRKMLEVLLYMHI